MDIISILGLLIGIVAIIGGQVFEGGHIDSLVQPTAFLIVFGGTLGAIMLQNHWPTFAQGVRMGRWVLIPPQIDYETLITQVANWSSVSRRDGLLALENLIGPLQDSFSRKGLQLLVDGAVPERLREVLDNEIRIYEQGLRMSAKVWESAGGYSPTIGILGAVLGLIHVMENLTDPAKLGGGIAVAFVATIYGVGLANLVYLPIANKLKFHIGRLVSLREMVVDGLVGIANGDHPHIIESRLRSYIY